LLDNRLTEEGSMRRKRRKGCSFREKPCPNPNTPFFR